MKVYDIVSEDQNITEAPAGILKQVGRKIGAKAAGAIGMKGTAAGLKGAAETGDEANNLKVALKGYAGKTGKDLNQMDASELAAFLKNQGYPTTPVQNIQGIVTKKQLDDILLKSVQAKHSLGGAPKQTPTTQQPSSSAGSSVASGAASFANKLAQKTGGIPAASKTPSATATTTAVPPAVLKKIKQLTPAQKQELARML